MYEMQQESDKKRKLGNIDPSNVSEQPMKKPLLPPSSICSSSIIPADFSVLSSSNMMEGTPPAEDPPAKEHQSSSGHQSSSMELNLTDEAAKALSDKEEGINKEIELWDDIFMVPIIQSLTVATATLQSPKDKNQFVLHHLPRFQDQTAERTSLHLFNTDQFNSTWKEIYSTAYPDITVVTGPPGCGKTVTTAIIFLHIAYGFDDQRRLEMSKDIDYIWINVQKAYLLKVSNRKLDQIQNVNPVITERTRLVVYDGVETKSETGLEQFKALLRRVNEKYIPRQIVVTSQQAGNVPKIVNTITSRRTKEIKFKPWTLEDYYEAIRNDAFFNDVRGVLCPDLHDPHVPIFKRVEAISNKYQFAGYCARFMFDMTEEDVKREIIKAVDRVPNFKDIMNVGVASTDAVNTIACASGKDSGIVLVSAFAARILALIKIVPMSDLNSFLEAAARVRGVLNPVLDGWVFELDFLARIKSAVNEIGVFNGRFHYYEGSLSTASSNNNIEVSMAIPFNSSAELDLTDDSHLRLNHSWYLPRKYDQGGFDAVELIDNKLRFYQITRAKTHSLKTEYMLSFLHKFNALRESNRLFPIVSFDIVFVVPYVNKLERWEFQMPENPVLTYAEAFEDRRGLTLKLEPNILNAASYLHTGLPPL